MGCCKHIIKLSYPVIPIMFYQDKECIFFTHYTAYEICRLRRQCWGREQVGKPSVGRRTTCFNITFTWSQNKWSRFKSLMNLLKVNKTQKMAPQDISCNFTLEYQLVELWNLIWGQNQRSKIKLLFLLWVVLYRGQLIIEFHSPLKSSTTLIAFLFVPWS